MFEVFSPIGEKFKWWRSGKIPSFLAGPDTIIVDCIVIKSLGTPVSASKRPIAHFCTPMVEVPHSNNSYLELWQEFINIL